MDLQLDSKLIDILNPDINDIIILSGENFNVVNNKLISNLENVIDTLGNLSAKVFYFLKKGARTEKYYYKLVEIYWVGSKNIFEIRWIQGNRFS